MVGQRVANKYELKRLLGSGSMGRVYEGVHMVLGKRLAIKLIHPEFGDSPEVIARFRREARAASAVDSDYIEQIFDFGRDEALGLYMVIEYLEGEDLEERLRRERWLGEKDAATIGLHVARGLAKAHGAGIIHRDLKPANIFLTRRDDDSTLAKLLDFGISKFETEPLLAEPTLTAYGTTLGTPQYMSPEQCEGTVSLDGRTDVWSLCAVLYETIAGEPAVPDRGGHIAVMTRIVGEDIAPLARRASWATLELASIIDAGLVRDRDRRIPTAAALAARLLAAFPEAGARSRTTEIARITDISELAPRAEAAPPTLRTGSPHAADADRTEMPSLPPPQPPLADSVPPESGDAASSPGSGDDELAIFARGELPHELVALRERRRRKGP